MKNGTLNKTEMATLAKAIDILNELNNWMYDNTNHLKVPYGTEWHNVMGLTAQAAGGISNFLSIAKLASLKGKAVKTAVEAIHEDNPNARIDFADAMYAEERFTSDIKGLENRRVRYIDNWKDLYCIHC